MRLKVKRLDGRAKLPTKAYKSAGYDLYCIDDVSLRSDRVTPVRIGIAMEIPEGYVGLLWDKSGRAIAGIGVKGGVIDADFRGEIIVLLELINWDAETYPFSKEFIPAGSKVAQILIQKVESLPIEEVDEFSETERGERGFGSSG